MPASPCGALPPGMLACALDLDDGVMALEISKGAGTEREGPTLKSMRVALLGQSRQFPGDYVLLTGIAHPSWRG